MDPVIVIAGLVFLVLAFIRRRNAANAYERRPGQSRLWLWQHRPPGGPGAGGYQGGGGYGALHSKAAAAAFWARWPVVRLRVRICRR
jgi:hypothetical protein